MAAKNDIDIIIGGKTFTLSGVESEEYLREVASYLNGKIREFSDDAAYWRLPNDMRGVMLQLNLADDYFKERSRAAAFEEQVRELSGLQEQKEKTIGEMKAKAEEDASRISELEADAAGLRDQARRASAAENSAAKRFGAEKSRADKLAEEMNALRKSKAESDKAVQRLRQELSELRDSLQSEMNRTKSDLEQKLSASEAQRKKEVQELQQLREKETRELKDRGQKEVRDVQTLREKEVQDLKTKRQKELETLRAQHEKELQQKEAQSKKTLKEREDSLQKALSETRDSLTRQLQTAKAEASERGKALEKANEEIRKLRSQLETARLNGENAQKKLAGLEKTFEEKLAAGTDEFRKKTQKAEEELLQVQEDLALLQEQESARAQTAVKIKSSMLELVQQYGRLGQSLDEAGALLRSLE